MGKTPLNPSPIDPPTLHDLQMDKGWGPPQPFTTCKWTRVSPPQPFTTCRWTRVGGPNPSRLANGQGLGTPNPSRLANGQRLDKGWGPPEFPPLPALALDKGWTPSTFRDLGWLPKSTLPLQHTFPSRPGALPEDRQVNDRALRPRTYPNANLKFCLDKNVASKPSNA